MDSLEGAARTYEPGPKQIEEVCLSTGQRAAAPDWLARSLEIAGLGSSVGPLGGYEYADPPAGPCRFCDAASAEPCAPNCPGRIEASS